MATAHTTVRRVRGSVFHRHRGTAVALVMLATCSLDVADAAPSGMAKAEVISSVQSSRAALGSLEVSATTTEFENGALVATRSWRERVAWTPQSARVEIEPIASTGPAFTYQFDGAVAMAYRPSDGIASVSVSPAKIAVHRIIAEYCMHLRWFPLQAACDQPEGTDLIQWLTQSNVEVAPNAEFVGDTECIRLDQRVNDAVVATVWLDGERGCLPRRAVWYRQDGSGAPLAQWDVLEFAELADGISIPSKMKYVYTGGAAESHGEVEVPAALVRETVIDKDATGNLLASLSPVFPEAGTLVLPAGTTVVDHDAGESWIVASSDVPTASALAVSEPSDVQVVPFPRSRTVWTLSGGVAGIGLTASIATMVTMRRRVARSNPKV
ncbi:MAG: hypothetical protein JNM94_13550 [Phycisphaerae bacterium]|nr:hypothetical protein [Phycisphaerae bacterium]